MKDYFVGNEKPITTLDYLTIEQLELYMNPDSTLDDFKQVAIKIEICEDKKRKSYRYVKWARLVKEKDNHTCTHCNGKDNLHSHHILSFKDHVYERYNVDNGITLCSDCHWDEHRRINKEIRDEKNID